MSTKGWQLILADKFCLKVTDGTHDSPKKTKIGKHLVTSKHIKGKNIDFDNTYLIGEDDFKKINQRSRVDQWDVIISMIGEYCGFCYVERNNVINYAVKNVGLFKVGDRTKAYWLYYYLNSKIGKDAIATYKSGTSQPYITLGSLRSLPILIPNQEETMKNIVSILSALDDKIELNRQTNQTLEAIAHAIFKEWFVDFRFPGSTKLTTGSATGEMQASELGTIPKGWRVGKLGEVVAVQNGYAFKSNDFKDAGEIKIIKIKNISGNLVDVVSTQFVDSEIVEKLDKKFKIEFGSLLIAMTGAEVGKIGLVPNSEKPLWLNQRVGMFVEKVKYANLFIYILLGTEEYQNTLQNSALGSAQPNISSSVIENISTIIPPVKVILNFGELVNPLFERILSNIDESVTLTAIRDSLLPKLMNGDI